MARDRSQVRCWGRARAWALVCCGLGQASLVQAAAPELVCEARYASETQTWRSPVVADPYQATTRQWPGRFSLRAVVLGQGERIDHITLSVHDLGGDGAPVMLQQVRLQPPFNTSPVIPALTGWQQVYASPLGRELRYGCALQEARP